MELLQLRYFQTVARMQSISNAAKYYNIPQPAMSQTITRLENSLGGIKLFDRRNGKLFLNDKGQEFLKYVDKCLLELDEGIASVGDVSSQNMTGMIRLKVMENHRLVLTCIPTFSKIYPDVVFSISHGYYEDPDISYDICISSSPAYKHMSWHVPLIKEKLVLAVSEDHPLAKEKTIKIKDLKNQKLITLPQQSALYSITKGCCNFNGFEPNIPIVCDDPYFVRKYVSEGMGVSLAPEVSWRGRFRENTVLIPVDDSPVLTSYIVMDGNKYPSSAVNTFKEYLIEEASKVEGNLISVK